MWTKLAEIIVENARAIHTATVARTAWLYLLESTVETIDLMPFFLRPFYELVCEISGVSITAGIPVSTTIFIFSCFDSLESDTSSSTLMAAKLFMALPAKSVLPTANTDFFIKSRLFIPFSYYVAFNKTL